MTPFIENISLKELTSSEKLSVRSTNLCEDNGLTNLDAILNFFWKKNGFLSLKNCGEKSNNELIRVCRKFETNGSKAFRKKTDNPIEKVIESLTVRQKKILNNLIASAAFNLSVRSLNAIERISESSLTIRGLKSILLNANYDLRQIRNIGDKTVKELRIFFNEIREQIEIIKLFENDEELTVELFNTVLCRIFSLNTNDIIKIWNKYDSVNGLPLFKTLDTLISNGFIYKDRELEIFKRGFNYWSNSQTESIEQIASNFDITRERTRQIRKQMLLEFEKQFSFIKLLEFDALNLYGIDVDADIISVNDNLIEEITQKEFVRYNEVFVIKILSILLKRTHKLIGNIESVAFNKLKYKGAGSRWNSLYLIKSEIEESFDFESLVIDIRKRLSERIEEDYSFHFETYLTAFQTDGVEIDYFVITQITEHIIFNEFEISIDTFDQITFRRNTKRQVIEYVYDILKEKNEPLDIYHIYETLISKYPNVTKSAEALRGSCQGDNNLIFFGRSSTYGLRRWEDNETIKGGTIRSITEEYLNDFDVPKHIFEITEHVNKFRDTNAKSIITNLKLDESSIFVFFNQSFVGLKSKKYEQEYYDLPKFFGKSIMWYIRKHNEITQDKLIEFIQSKIKLNRNAIVLIIKQLEQDKYLKIDNFKITQYDRN